MTQVGDKFPGTKICLLWGDNFIKATGIDLISPTLSDEVGSHKQWVSTDKFNDIGFTW